MVHDDKNLTSPLDTLKVDYLKALPGKIVRLQTHIENQEWPQVSDEFHKLKGTGSTYGFPDISAVCQKLEAFAQLKEMQKPRFFMDALDLLQKMHVAYSANTSFDIETHPFGKTLLSSGTRK